MSDDRIVVIGAGPAGMGCANTLAAAGRPCMVIEKDRSPGGLCQTINYNGYLFDMGGHRFLSRSADVNRLWREVMGDDMLHVKRLSRIYYRKKYFNYPLSFFNTFWNLGPIESFLCVASYLKWKAPRPSDDETFESWIIRRFGKRLYNIFFKVYTEKVWAVPCSDISADWAQQRIQGLSLRVAIKKAILGSGEGPKTLSEEFFYPRTGPGEFYKRLMESDAARCAQFLFGRTVVKIKHDGQKIISVVFRDFLEERTEEVPVGHLCSSMPLPVLVDMLEPRAPEEVMAAAGKLSFRSFLTVNVILDKEHVFPDQWIYVHSPEVRLGRIQNYKNWSPAMVVDLKKTSLGLEYFCTEDDNLWVMNDVELINYALGELEKIGIASRRHFITGFVVRRSHAYPVYALDYRKHVNTIRMFLGQFSNLQTIGRSGLFRYDNSDHALTTGICAARNILGPERRDIWEINTDKEYLES